MKKLLALVLPALLVACANHGVVPTTTTTKAQTCTVNPLSGVRSKYCTSDAPSPQNTPYQFMAWYAMPYQFHYYPSGSFKIGGYAVIPRQGSCNGSMAINTTVNGSNLHSNQISNAFEVFVTANGVSQMIGWEYQTYGGQEYFQLAGSFSLSASGGVGFVSASWGYSYNTPIVPFTGSVYGAVQTIIDALGFGGKALPFPFNTLTPSNGNVRQARCFA